MPDGKRKSLMLRSALKIDVGACDRTKKGPRSARRDPKVRSSTRYPNGCHAAGGYGSGLERARAVGGAKKGPRLPTGALRNLVARGEHRNATLKDRSILSGGMDKKTDPGRSRPGPWQRTWNIGQQSTAPQLQDDSAEAKCNPCTRRRRKRGPRRGRSGALKTARVEPGFTSTPQPQNRSPAKQNSSPTPPTEGQESGKLVRLRQGRETPQRGTGERPKADAIVAEVVA
jgi:hypothetical protein